jgi:hypothetical protein
MSKSSKPGLLLRVVLGAGHQHTDTKLLDEERAHAAVNRG